MQAQERHLCIVPVLHGKTGEAGIVNYRLDALGPKVFKNSPLLVAYLWHSTIDTVTASAINTVTLDADRTLLPISGNFFFPIDQLIHRSAVEPSGRVVAIGGEGRIYVAERGVYQFSPVKGAASGLQSPPVWLTTFGATGIVTKDGLMLLEGDGLVPIDGIDWTRTGPLSRVFDLPRFNVTALATEDGRLFLLDAEKHLTQVEGIDLSSVSTGDTRQRDEISQVAEADGLLLVKDMHFPEWTYAVSMVPDGPRYASSRAVALPTMYQWTGWAYYAEVGQVLAFGQPGIFSWPSMYKLDGTGPVAIASGRNRPSGEVKFDHIASRHEVVITSASGISVYDGQAALRDVAGWNNQALGQTTWIYDLPALDKVLIAGAQGVFELTRDDRLVELPLPPNSGTHVGKVVEMPASQAAVVFTEKTVLALDRTGHFSSIAGADRVEPRTLGFNKAVNIPVREEVFVQAQNDHFLVRDEAITGPGSCDAAERRAPPARECSIAFDSPDLGIKGPITTVVETARERRALISTSKGGFQADDQDHLSPYAPLASAGIYLTFPWGAHLLQTQTGYELLEPDGSRHSISTNWGHYTYLQNFHYIGFAARAHMVVFGNGGDHADVLGPDYKIAPIPNLKFSVEAVTEVPWAERPLVYSGGQLYLLEPDRSLTPLLNREPFAAAAHSDSWAAAQRFFEFQPLPQFDGVLAGDASTGNWELIAPTGDHKPLPALRGQDELSPIAANPVLDWVSESASSQRVVLRFFHSQWVLTSMGETQRLPDQIGRARAIADLPGSEDSIIGTDKGLYRLGPNGDPQAVPDACADQVGAVRKMTTVPWHNELLIEASNGVFSYSADEGLRSLPAFHWTGRAPKVFVLPNLKQIWALDPGVQYGDGSIYLGQLRRIELGTECRSAN
jgi:hypothetical protein